MYKQLYDCLSLCMSVYIQPCICEPTPMSLSALSFTKLFMNQQLPTIKLSALQERAASKGVQALIVIAIILLKGFKKKTHVHKKVKDLKLNSAKRGKATYAFGFILQLHTKRFFYINVLLQTPRTYAIWPLLHRLRERHMLGVQNS